MGINDIILIILAFFLCLGLLDRCFNNRFGLGAEVEKAFALMPLLAFAIVGIMSIAPVLAEVLRPVVVPAYKALGADPAMFIASILGSDGGGYSIIQKLGESPDAINFAGFIVGMTIAPTVTFTIPVIMSIIDKKDHKYAAVAILGALIPTPIGCFIGGLVAGFSPSMLLSNLVPIVIFAALLCLGLALRPNALVRGFAHFARFMTFLMMFGLAVAAVESLTGIALIKGMTPISAGFSTVGYIVLIVGGSFPLLYVINKAFKGPISAMARLLKIDNVAATGLIISFSNAIPAFGQVSQMTPRGKVFVLSFAVCFAYILGSQLGYLASVNRAMMIPMMVAKAACGILGVTVAVFIAGRIYPECRGN